MVSLFVHFKSMTLPKYILVCARVCKSKSKSISILFCFYCITICGSAYCCPTTAFLNPHCSYLFAYNFSSAHSMFLVPAETISILVIAQSCLLPLSRLRDATENALVIPVPNPCCAFIIMVIHTQ